MYDLQRHRIMRLKEWLIPFRQAIFGERNTLNEAIVKKGKALQDIGRSYCFLLLHVSSATRQPSKDRMWFEVTHFLLCFLYNTLIQRALDYVWDGERDKQGDSSHARLEQPA